MFNLIVLIKSKDVVQIANRPGLTPSLEKQISAERRGRGRGASRTNGERAAVPAYECVVGPFDGHLTLIDRSIRRDGAFNRADARVLARGLLLARSRGIMRSRQYSNR